MMNFGALNWFYSFIANLKKKKAFAYKPCGLHLWEATYIITAKLLHNRDIVSVHLNYFQCTEICDKLSRDLCMLSYIYLDVDEYRLTSSMP